MTMFKYNYKTIADVDVSELYDGDATLKNALNLTIKNTSYNGSSYGIIKYDKKKLTDEKIETSGLFRSIVYKNKKIIAIAPPKSASYNTFMTQHDLYDCVVEEYVEGTMINLFYEEDSGEWEIATRSTVGGKTNYTISRFSSLSFRDMFLEASNNANFEFDILDKTLCYSFVLQHPKNRIVVPFKETQLYLVACYRINENYTIDAIDIKTVKESLNSTKILYPKQFDDINEVYNLTELMSDSFGDYTVVGFMIHHHASGTRCKIRNEGTYEYVRKLRGNQPKEQYRYLELCHNGRLDEYVNYYPEDKEVFNKYRDEVNYYITSLYQNYVNCFIKKMDVLKNYPYQFKTHMYQLHQIYLNEIKPGNMQYNNVVQYVNRLPPAKLMFVLNYHLRSAHQT